MGVGFFDFTYSTVVVECSRDGVGHPVKSDQFEDLLQGRILVRPFEDLFSNPVAFVSILKKGKEGRNIDFGVRELTS